MLQFIAIVDRQEFKKRHDPKAWWQPPPPPLPFRLIDSTVMCDEISAAIFGSFEHMLCISGVLIGRGIALEDGANSRKLLPLFGVEFGRQRENLQRDNVSYGLRGVWVLNLSAHTLGRNQIDFAIGL